MIAKHFAALLLAAGCLNAAPIAAADPGEKSTYPLSAEPRGWEFARVVADLKIGGHFTLRNKDEDEKVPMSVVARLEFDQRLPESTTQVVVRHYDVAKATIKIGQGGMDRILSETRRLLVAKAADRQVTLHDPHGPLSRDHLDLLNIVADPLALDGLLPNKRLAVGETFRIEQTSLQRLLRLEEIAAAEVESAFVAVEPGYAKIRLAGSVHGVVDGATTELQLRASYLFHLENQRMARCNLAIREDRAIGPVGPGIEAVSQLRLSMDPLPKSEKLTDAIVEELADSAAEATGDLVYEATKLGVRLRHDRNWFVTSEEPNRIVLRRVERGDLIAQCNLIRMPPSSKSSDATLQQFQKDIRFSLGKRLDRLVSARTWTSQTGLPWHRVLAHGKIDDVPVEWRYYLAVPEKGPRLALAISIEGQLVKQFASADDQLVESLQLLGEAAAPASTAAKPRKEPPAAGESATRR